MMALAAVLLIVAACASTSDDSAASSGDGDVTQTSQDNSGTESTMESEVVVASVDPSAPIPGTQEDLVQNVGDRVFFDYDSAVLSPEGRRTLERQAEWLRLFPDHSIMIEGHADERGTREYNLALGERRASAVRDYLVALGINANRLKTLSYGKERPVNPGSTNEDWGKNRRGVMVVD